MQTKTIKKQAEKLLQKHIEYAFRNTDMGSGYYFQLVSPFENHYGIVNLEDHLYLDTFEGETKEEYKEWKEDLFNSSLEEFNKKVKSLHLDCFVEYLLQKDELMC